MLKQSLLTAIIVLTSISLVSSLQCMEITAKITDSQESYWQHKQKYILCAQFDKATQTYSACRYWDADCITPKEDGQRIFNVLKARYEGQKETKNNITTAQDTDKTIE